MIRSLPRVPTGESNPPAASKQLVVHINFQTQGTGYQPRCWKLRHNMDEI